MRFVVPIVVIGASVVTAQSNEQSTTNNMSYNAAMRFVVAPDSALLPPKSDVVNAMGVENISLSADGTVDTNSRTTSASGVLAPPVLDVSTDKVPNLMVSFNERCISRMRDDVNALINAASRILSRGDWLKFVGYDDNTATHLSQLRVEGMEVDDGYTDILSVDANDLYPPVSEIFGITESKRDLTIARLNRYKPIRSSVYPSTKSSTVNSDVTVNELVGMGFKVPTTSSFDETEYMNLSIPHTFSVDGGRDFLSADPLSVLTIPVKHTFPVDDNFIMWEHRHTDNAIRLCGSDDDESEELVTSTGSSTDDEYTTYTEDEYTTEGYDGTPSVTDINRANGQKRKSRSQLKRIIDRAMNGAKTTRASGRTSLEDEVMFGNDGWGLENEDPVTEDGLRVLVGRYGSRQEVENFLQRAPEWMKQAPKDHPKAILNGIASYTSPEGLSNERYLYVLAELSYKLTESLAKDVALERRRRRLGAVDGMIATGETLDDMETRLMRMLEAREVLRPLILRAGHLKYDVDALAGDITEKLVGLGLVETENDVADPTHRRLASTTLAPNASVGDVLRAYIDDVMHISNLKFLYLSAVDVMIIYNSDAVPQSVFQDLMNNLNELECVAVWEPDRQMELPPSTPDIPLYQNDELVRDPYQAFLKSDNGGMSLSQYLTATENSLMPDDPLMDRQWYLYGPDSDMPYGTGRVDLIKELSLRWGVDDFVAYTTTTNLLRQLPVAIVDSGCWFYNKDLSQTYYHCNDDPGCFGCDYSIGTACYDPTDTEVSHGSSTSSLVAATQNNAYAIAGLCAECKLVCLKITDRSGTISTSSTVRAIEHIIKYKIELSNNSYGGFGYDAIQDKAFQKLSAAGSLAVVAAGNYNCDMDCKPASGLACKKTQCLPSYGGYYPPQYNYTNMLNVSAHDPQGKIASFSNVGAKTVDVFAPGTRIIAINLKYGATGSTIQGTSFAAPIVTGLIGSVKTLFPDVSINQIRNMLTQSLYPNPNLRNAAKNAGTASVISLVRSMYKAGYKDALDATTTTTTTTRRSGIVWGGRPSLVLGGVLQNSPPKDTTKLLDSDIDGITTSEGTVESSGGSSSSSDNTGESSSSDGNGSSSDSSSDGDSTSTESVGSTEERGNLPFLFHDETTIAEGNQFSQIIKGPGGGKIAAAAAAGAVAGAAIPFLAGGMGRSNNQLVRSEKTSTTPPPHSASSSTDHTNSLPSVSDSLPWVTPSQAPFKDIPLSPPLAVGGYTGARSHYQEQQNQKRSAQSPINLSKPSHHHSGSAHSNDRFMNTLNQPSGRHMSTQQRSRHRILNERIPLSSYAIEEVYNFDE